jgi:hypothetical protein
MTNHYASLTVQQLHRSYEKYPPLMAEKGRSMDKLISEASALRELLGRALIYLKYKEAFK